MNYNKVVELIAKQDSRNIFEKSNKSLPWIPSGLKKFYLEYNPVNVEIILKDLTSIKLFSQDKLLEIQKEYRLNDDLFVFATREGDPIAITTENKIITFAHGTNKYTIQVLANNFDEFLIWIINEMRK